MIMRPGLVPNDLPNKSGSSSSVGDQNRSSSDEEQGIKIPPIPSHDTTADHHSIPRPQRFMTEEEKERVKEIDRMIQEGQKRILELQIKKDALQRSPNPFYNYYTSKFLGGDRQTK
jgi:hypothetical protein